MLTEPSTAAAVAGEVRRLTTAWKNDPASFVLESFPTDPYGHRAQIDPAQREILEAVKEHDRVVVRTGRGTGKTASAALITHWWLGTRRPSLVVTSAGTWNHLEEKLWPEIRAWGRCWLLRDAFEYQSMRIYNQDDPDSWRVVAASSDKAVNVEGYHSPNLLVLIDEAKGMPDEIFAALVGSLSGDSGPGTQKIVALSTPPVSKAGWFARVSESSEWASIHVSGLDSPRVSRAYVEEIRGTFGEESPEFQSYVLGEIPEGASETVIQSRWLEQAQKAQESEDRRPVVVTCDVAREGDDLTTFGLFRNAKFSLTRFENDGRPGWLAHADLMHVAGRCMRAVSQHQAAALCVDDTGLGGGVTDRLRELQAEGAFPQECQIVGVKFGRKARRFDRFHSTKDELWWAAREALRQGHLALPTDSEIRTWECPRGSEFKTQMLASIYEYDSLDRIRVLDKRVSGREKTKALPAKSPDLAHAFILGAQHYLRQMPEETPAPLPKTQEDRLWRTLQETVKKIERPPMLNPFQR